MSKEAVEEVGMWPLSHPEQWWGMKQHSGQIPHELISFPGLKGPNIPIKIFLFANRVVQTSVWVLA